MKVLRIYHAGRDRTHRLREQALAEAGLDVTLVVPSAWPDRGAQQVLTPEPFRVIELPVSRPGDVNRHRWTADLKEVLADVRPDLVDIHEEPFSLAARQWLRAAGVTPSVAYAAQNVDKRFPPPFAQYEKSAFARLAGIYPCSAQAASVVRGKGYAGVVEVLALGRDAASYASGAQSSEDTPVVLGLVGRLVPEKGVLDAVRVLAAVRRVREARLLVIGQGPEEAAGRLLAAELGVVEFVEWHPWREEMAAAYREMHVVLLPSRSTQTWTEQFGRVIVEAQASGAVVAGYASGSIPEVLGSAGVVVAEGDVSGLSAAVIDVLGSRFAGLRAAGLAQVEAMTWEQIGRRQIAFYERVLSRPSPVVAGRSAARAEFGAPATLLGGVARPFALPLLRKDNRATRALGAVVDAVSSPR